MKKSLLSGIAIMALSNVVAQTATAMQEEPVNFTEIITAPVSPVKNQAMTGTCWCFGTTSLVESQCMRKNGKEIDLSEMFTVRNIYIEKAKNYVLRQGHAQFGEGGLGHDLIRAIATYGAMPEEVYSGLPNGQTMLNHQKMVAALQAYLDTVIKNIPVQSNWLEGYVKILTSTMGEPPADFTYNGKKYTPKTFAKDVLNFNPDDYVNITSFTHQPYYKSFILQVPDNFSNGYYYNLPLDEMMNVVKQALQNGSSVMWDADVSNNGFRQNIALAMNLKAGTRYDNKDVKADMTEEPFDATIRQQLYENLTTQDDHLMHITGLEKSPDGKEFFKVKNSWGNIGPDKGYINVSMAYFAINTVSLVVPKSALNKELLEKLGIR